LPARPWNERSVHVLQSSYYFQKPFDDFLDLADLQTSHVKLETQLAHSTVSKTWRVKWLTR